MNYSQFETPTALRNDLHSLADSARSLLDATSEATDRRITEAREHLLRTLDRGRDGFCRMQERTFDGARAAERVVRDHPVSTAAVALGLGAILLCLLSGRRD